jgi:hypothetical protein
VPCCTRERPSDSDWRVWHALDSHTSCRQRGVWEGFQCLQLNEAPSTVCAVLFGLRKAPRAPCFAPFELEQQSPWLNDALLSSLAGMVGTLGDIRFWLYARTPQRLCAPATVRMIIGFANAGSRHAFDLCALRKIAGQQHAGPIRDVVHSFLLCSSSPKHRASRATSTANWWREDTAVWH